MTIPKNWNSSINAQQSSLKGQAKKEGGIKKDGEISKVWLLNKAKTNTITGVKAQIFLNKQ